MKRVFAWIVAILAGHASADAGVASPLNYDQMILLDAEALAETGIGEAYERIKPVLSRYAEHPIDIVEHINSETPSYSVSAAGETYDIDGPDLDHGAGESWGRATVALFEIVNSQLQDSGVRFYAINGGNDLSGMFLTPNEVDVAKRTLKRKTDWPYLPVLDHPNYGQHQ